MSKTLFAVGLAAIAVPALGADPATIDWSRVPASAVTLFYPGQSSYEWLRNDHKKGKGAKAVADGQACVRCHEGDEKAMGAAIVKGGALEPTPVNGKNGHIELKVQAAYDDKNAYLRFQWRTNADRGNRVPVLPLRRQGMEVLRLSEARPGRAGGQAARHLRRPHDDHDRRRQGARLRAPGLLADLPRRLARHAKQFAERRSGGQCAAHRDQEGRRAQVSAGHPHRSGRLEDRQVARGDRQDQGRRRFRRPDPVARAPLARGGHGRRRLRARVSQLRRGQGHVRQQRRCRRPMRRSSCGTRRRSGYKSITANELRKGDIS